MAELKINDRMSVQALKAQLYQTFGGILRVYNGKSEADEEDSLAAIGANEDELLCDSDLTVGEFIDKMADVFGINVKVATKDNWVLVLNDILLSRIHEIPKNTTRKEMEKFLSDKREENIEKADNEVKNNDYDKWKTEHHERFFEDFTEDELDEYKDLFANYCEYDDCDQVLIVKNGDAYAKLAKGPSGELYMQDMDGDGPYCSYFSIRNRQTVVWVAERWFRLKDVEQLASDVIEGDYISCEDYE